MIDFNKLIEWNMGRSIDSPRTRSTAPWDRNVEERDRLVSEFLSLWVKAHTLTTIPEVEQCRIDACNIWWEIKDLDPDYSLWDVDFRSTGYRQPLLYLHPLDRYEHPSATFEQQLIRVGKLERWRNPDSQMSNQYNTDTDFLTSAASVAAAASVLF